MTEVIKTATTVANVCVCVSVCLCVCAANWREERERERALGGGGLGREGKNCLDLLKKGEKREDIACLCACVCVFHGFLSFFFWFITTVFSNVSPWLRFYPLMKPQSGRNVRKKTVLVWGGGGGTVCLPRFVLFFYFIFLRIRVFVSTLACKLLVSAQQMLWNQIEPFWGDELLFQIFTLTVIAEIFVCDVISFQRFCNFRLVANQTMRAHTFMWQRHCCTKIYCACNFANARVRNFYSYDNFCDYSAYLLVCFYMFLLYLTSVSLHKKMFPMKFC